MHSTTVAGEGQNPGEKQLKELAVDFGVKNINTIIKEVKLVCSNWLNYAKGAEVTTVSTKIIARKINELVKH